MTNISDVPLTPRLVSGPYDVFDIDYSGKAIKSGGSTNMTVRVKNGNKVKTAKKSFTFEFDDAKRTRFTLAAQLLLEERQAIRPTSNPSSGGGK